MLVRKYDEIPEIKSVALIQRSEINDTLFRPCVIKIEHTEIINAETTHIIKASCPLRIRGIVIKNRIAMLTYNPKKARIPLIPMVITINTKKSKRMKGV